MSSFDILKNKRFLFFYITVFLSNIGSWIQNVALSWLALTLKNESLSFGFISFLSSIPSLFFSFIGGYLADFFDNKKILIFSQILSLSVAFYLGLSVYFNSSSYKVLALLAFISGIGSAISYPLYYNILVSFVEVNEIPSLIALNSLQFNLSRFIGPTIFSGLVLIVGIGGCFIINGISYLPFLGALLFIVTFKKKTEKINKNFFVVIKDGFDYVIKDKDLFKVIKLVFVYSFFVLPFVGLLPYYIKNYIKDSAHIVGIVMGILGLGTIFGALYMTFAPSDSVSILTRIFKSGFIFSIFLALLGNITNFYAFCIVAFIIGFFMVLFYASANSCIHLLSKHEYRGRLASFFTSVYLGVYPIGVLITGLVAKYVQLNVVFTFQAFISLIYTLKNFSIRNLN